MNWDKKILAGIALSYNDDIKRETNKRDLIIAPLAYSTTWVALTVICMWAYHWSNLFNRVVYSIAGICLIFINILTIIMVWWSSKDRVRTMLERRTMALVAKDNL